MLVWAYREWKKKGLYINLKQQGWEVDQEIDGKMKWRRMEDQLVENGGRTGYITVRNGRSSWERHGIGAFCTCQRNERMNVSGKNLSGLTSCILTMPVSEPTVTWLIVWLYLQKSMILTFSLPVWLVLICHHYVCWVFPVTQCCRPRWTEATSQSDFVFWCWP